MINHELPLSAEGDTREHALDEFFKIYTAAHLSYVGFKYWKIKPEFNFMRHPKGGGRHQVFCLMAVSDAEIIDGQKADQLTIEELKALIG